MNIQGFQKLTLLDYPDHMACTVFTGGCNMRCPFCHNASLVLRPGENPAFFEEEIYAFLKKRQGILDGVAITGGEPLLQHGLEEFILRVRELGFAVKLDTNGSYPERLAALIDKGLLDFVAMDIKNSRERYAETVGVANFDIAPIEQSVALLRASGVPFEFRTTVVRELHSAEDIEDMGVWLVGDHKHYLQGFIDSGDLIRGPLSGYDKNQMLDLLNVLKAYIPKAELRGVE
ncbi:MAG: anaerobic ribonucleoside-triphosphate reductase activating protein [Ruminococcaceae bacterium]|nr:anaerobic ribonucleoside-triphosphate reductase activating protein [Oscillospiraceae bacterium]